MRQRRRDEAKARKEARTRACPCAAADGAADAKLTQRRKDRAHKFGHGLAGVQQRVRRRVRVEGGCGERLAQDHRRKEKGTAIPETALARAAARRRSFGDAVLPRRHVGAREGLKEPRPAARGKRGTGIATRGCRRACWRSSARHAASRRRVWRWNGAAGGRSCGCRRAQTRKPCCRWRGVSAAESCLGDRCAPFRPITATFAVSAAAAASSDKKGKKRVEEPRRRRRSGS